MSLPIATASIVTQAFRFLERTPPASLHEVSDEARNARDAYPIALRECLDAYDWAFASRLADMALFDTARAGRSVVTHPDMPHLYALPGDCVRLREVGDNTVKWQLDADGLRADAPPPLRIRYTAMVLDEDRAPAAFQTAVALRLAWLLGRRYTVTNSQLDALSGEYAQTMAAAMRADTRGASNRRYDGQPEQGDWAAEARL